MSVEIHFEVRKNFKKDYKMCWHESGHNVIIIKSSITTVLNNEVVKSGEKAVDVFFVCDILIQVVRTQRKSDDSTSLKHVNLIQKVLKKCLTKYSELGIIIKSLAHDSD